MWDSAFESLGQMLLRPAMLLGRAGIAIGFLTAVHQSIRISNFMTILRRRATEAISSGACAPVSRDGLV